MRKLFNLIWMVFGFLLLVVGCSEDKKSTAFDPNQPVKFIEFMPDSGGIRTKFIVKGSNFGEDKSQVKVFFKDEVGNEREALVLGIKPDVIYAQVPKQAGGESHVRVEVSGKEAELSSTEKTFKYIVTSSVSTVVGKAKEGGNKDGTLSETTFNNPRYVAVDNDDNVFIFDSDGRTRLSSIGQNKTITLLDGMVINQPLFVDKERKQLFGPCDNATAFGCFLFDANVSWVAEKMGHISNGWMHSVVLDPVDSTFIVYRQNTGELWTQPFDKNKKTLSISKAKRIGTLFSGGANGLCAYNPVDKYVYCVLHSRSAVYRFKLKRDADNWPALDGDIEEYIPGAGAGFRDGDVQEAQFSEPRGIAIDKEGNLYIADVNNNRIRKVDTKLNVVTTIAGSGTAGYKDGDPLEAQFNTPVGVYLDKNEFLYIADEKNHCIRKLAIE